MQKNNVQIRVHKRRSMPQMTFSFLVTSDLFIFYSILKQPSLNKTCTTRDVAVQHFKTAIFK